MSLVDQNPTAGAAIEQAITEILEGIGVRGEFFCEEQRQRWLADIDLGDDEPDDAQPEG